MTLGEALKGRYHRSYIPYSCRADIGTLWCARNVTRREPYGPDPRWRRNGECCTVLSCGDDCYHGSPASNCQRNIPLAGFFNLLVEDSSLECAEKASMNAFALVYLLFLNHWSTYDNFADSMSVPISSALPRIYGGLPTALRRHRMPVWVDPPEANELVLN